MLAALLHDIGHPPFSHAAENLLPMKAPENYSLFQGMAEPIERYAHEDYSAAIIETLLKDLIEQHPCNRRNYKITTDEVTALISKRTPGGGPVLEGHNQWAAGRRQDGLFAPGLAARGGLIREI
jgi:HD superfamily phosphohydrolase